MNLPVDRDAVLTLLQFALGAAALLWVLTQPDWPAVWGGLRRLSPAVVLAIVVVSAIGILARFYTWVALVERYRDVDLWTGGRIDLSVNFVNQLLPSRLSGRVAAPLVVRQFSGIEWNRAVAVAIAHTALFALLYGVASLAGLLVAARRLSAPFVLLILLSTGLYFVAGVGILGAAIRLDRPMPSWLERVRALPVIAPAWSKASDALLDFPLELATVAPLVRDLVSARRVAVTYGLAWLLALAVVPGVRLWLLFGGMGSNAVSLFALPLVVVAAYSVTLLPLTPGGIGVTEATATVVFVALGVPSSVAVPAVLIDRFVGVYLPAVCGWYPTMSLGLEELREG